MSFLEELFGANYEIIVGFGGAALGFIGVGVSRFIKNKLAGNVVSNVTKFFTSDLTASQKDELGSIVKDFGSRKTLKLINGLVKQLDNLDIDKAKEQVNTGFLMLSGVLTVMISNGAFDDKPELKTKLQEAISKWVY